MSQSAIVWGLDVVVAIVAAVCFARAWVLWRRDAGTSESGGAAAGLLATVSRLESADLADLWAETYETRLREAAYRRHVQRRLEVEFFVETGGLEGAFRRLSEAFTGRRQVEV